MFVDEIDAVGRSRGTGIGGTNDEREQTLNQMLTEMDGFEGNTGIIVIAATNRADILDPALLRPGRFDRQVSKVVQSDVSREYVWRVMMARRSRVLKSSGQQQTCYLRSRLLTRAASPPLSSSAQVSVDLPDQKGRLEILKVHARNKKVAEDVDLQEVAMRTPGFAGANLMNLLNEAAILAGRRGLKVSARAAAAAGCSGQGGGGPRAAEN
mgnify:CR=1 FL=1